MPKVFSEHVQALAESREIDPAIRHEIERVLSAELRRRGIWDFGPSLLGYVGATWNDREAMDDLVQDCYIRAIISRRRSLQVNLESSGDIEKLVRKNIRSFVGEQQARLDPLGNAVFQNIKAVVLELTESGILKRLDSGTAPVSGDSEFVFAGREGVASASVGDLKEALKNTGVLFDEL